MESNRKVKLENHSGWLIGGGLLASMTAALCCIGPLLLTLIGVSGGAVLAKFEFLRTPMLFVMLLVFGWAGYLLFRKPNSCAPGSICSNPRKFKMMVLFYFVGLMASILIFSSPYWIVWIFD